MFVHPWMGIIANIPTTVQGGKHVGESGRKLREELTEKGFNPVRVHPLWNRHGHSGFAIVEFNKEWDGFNNAIMFERSFEADHCGKKDFYRSRRRRDKLYGWVAREDDYHSRGLIGDYLHRNGDLKTVSEKEAEDQRKDSKLLTTLANTLETKNMHLKEMENKCNEVSQSISTLMEQKDEMIKAYNEETKNMQQNAHDYLKKISLEHERTTQHLYDKKRKLEQREKELFHRKAQNGAETRKLKHEKMMNERATLEQKKADENMLRLAEEQKRETEKLHREVIELEKQLDAKQALELEIQRMKGALQVMQHMEGDGETEMKTKMNAIEEELKDKEEELDDLEELNQALIVKERKTNDELEGARKEIINSLKDVSTPAFHWCRENKKTAKQCLLWQEYLWDPSWHPFKIITDKEGNTKEILDEEDEKLTTLKTEFGDEVYTSVTRAFAQMNEHKTSGSYTAPALWNFNEGRMATLAELVEHLLKQWKQQKRKRCRRYF
ncbi:factor of DNA methylation 4-like isoform X2 [Herrania umbratica]|nr:factor of DNA methylation 4-like isoform X2 [Herrania umbratica]